jgi:hypothetical protein
LYDLFARSGWGLVAPFAFAISLGATLVFGGAYYWLTRSNEILSSRAAYFIFGALFGPLAFAVAIYLFDADMFADALAAPPEGVSISVIAAAFAVCGGVSALASRVAGARWKGAER